MHHIVMPPDADMHQLSELIWDKMDIDIFPQRHVGDFNFVLEQGNAAVGVDDASDPQAEDILRRTIRFGEGEFAKQAVAFFVRLLEANIGDFARSGMDLPVVVVFDFRLEHFWNFVSS